MLTRKAAAAMPRPMAIVEAIGLAVRMVIVQYYTNARWVSIGGSNLCASSSRKCEG